MREICRCHVDRVHHVASVDGGPTLASPSYPFYFNSYFDSFCFFFCAVSFCTFMLPNATPCLSVCILYLLDVSVSVSASAGCICICS